MSDLVQAAADLLSVQYMRKPVSKPVQLEEDVKEQEVNIQSAANVLSRLHGMVPQKDSGMITESEQTIRQPLMESVSKLLTRQGYNHLMEEKAKDERAEHTHSEAVDMKQKVASKLKNGDTETADGHRLTYGAVEQHLNTIERSLHTKNKNTVRLKQDIDLARMAIRQGRVHGEQIVRPSHARLIGKALAGEATIDADTGKVQ